MASGPPGPDSNPRLRPVLSHIKAPIWGLKPPYFLISPCSLISPVLVDFPFAVVMGLTAPMVIMLILGVVVVFVIVVMYNRRMRTAPVCGIQNLGAPVLVLTTNVSESLVDPGHA